MADQSTHKRDRRNRSREKLVNLVACRNETLVLFSELIGRRPFLADQATELALKRFCQVLIDYAASAHFQLYRYIADGRERRRAVLDVAQQVYPRIALATDAILEFNDRYDVSPLDDRVNWLEDDLSRLGEMLAERIQLEDQIIEALHGKECRRAAG